MLSKKGNLQHAVSACTLPGVPLMALNVVCQSSVGNKGFEDLRENK